VPIVLKSGSLNLLETSGPVRACNGIALPVPRYDLVPKLVAYIQVVKVNPPYNVTKSTDGKIVPSKTTDVTFRVNIQGTCMLMNVPVHADRNVTNKEVESF
jgi:hypothetical protein